MNNAITYLVGEELGRRGCWRGTLAAPNGSLYGIPYRARRVAKFNPADKSMTDIGPDFGGEEYKWYGGAITGSGIIYCPPPHCHRGILKIDTNTDNVTELNVNLLPEQGRSIWLSCAAALDGCIYFMPSEASRIMKLDPNNNDAMSSVGDDLGGHGWKYVGTVVGIDGCVYGIPCKSKRIIKYDPINDITSFVGEKADFHFECSGNGALGRDGCIYALTEHEKVLKIDTVNNSHCFVGVHDYAYGSKDAVLGIDGCIYWPQYINRYTLKYDPHSNQTSCLRSQFEADWKSGALASDGVIYCFPSNANQVLAVDPIGELLATTKANMLDHPEEFGCLFQTIEADEDSDEDSALSLTNFDHAVIKFGQTIVFEILEKAMKPVNDYCKESNLFPFMIAASYKEGPVCAINHLLRRDLSWANSCTISSLEGSVSKNKKRRIK